MDYNSIGIGTGGGGAEGDSGPQYQKWVVLEYVSVPNIWVIV